MTPGHFDIGVAGGGPAGLALAIEAATLGLSTVVLERQAFPVDKACGEGLMPAGLVALERLGVLPHLDRDECAPFLDISWVQEQGRSALGRLPSPGGLGIRRVALHAALAARARVVGVTLEEETPLRRHAIDAKGVSLHTDRGELRVQVLVAADGLHSPLRRAEGLELRASGPRRYGLRRHLRRAWPPRVEVRFAPGVEAYVTPAGRERVGVAFLWNEAALGETASFEVLLARFPALGESLAGVPFDSEVRGAGPLLQRVSRRVKDRLVLLGDAAGYVDAITGEGLSLAFSAAHQLAELLPEALRRHGVASAFAAYERATERSFRSYARLAQALVWVADRPALRRFAVDRLSDFPGLFTFGLGRAMDRGEVVVSSPAMARW